MKQNEVVGKESVKVRLSPRLITAAHGGYLFFYEVWYD